MGIRPTTQSTCSFSERLPTRREGSGLFAARAAFRIYLNEQLVGAGTTATIPVLCWARLVRSAAFVSLSALVALAACTRASVDAGPDHLERPFEDSGQNFALSFDGVDDYATTATAEFPDGRHEQTLSAWFQVATLADRVALLTLRKDFDSGIELGLRQGLVGAWRVYGDRPQVIAKTAITSGVWHHAAYTFDGTTNQLYVDGVLVASSTELPDKRTPTSCWLGTLDGTRDLFKGRMDDVHVFQIARSAEQIAAEFAGKFSAGEDGLVLDLSCDETAGSLVFDHSERENDGQLGDGVISSMPARVPANLAQSEH